MSTVTAVPATLKVAERINRIEPSATMAVVAEADKLRQSGVDVVDMSVGEPHFSTPQHIKDAAIAAINGELHALHRGRRDGGVEGRDPAASRQRLRLPLQA